MGLFSKILSHCTGKIVTNNEDHKTNYIFYKIVGASEKGVSYTLQCINTNAIFSAHIMDIVMDPTLLYALHPVQACYVGMKYADFLRNTEGSLSPHDKNKNKHQWVPSRYGQYYLTHQDRKGNIGFLNKETGEASLMPPRQIALSEVLINEFDAAQAFYIGLNAAFKTTLEKSLSNKRPFLFVVK
jgi:hypothetical protein